MTPHISGMTRLAADGAAKSGPGVLRAILLHAGSGAAATVLIYDNASAASGDVLASLGAQAAASAQWTPAAGYPCKDGLYADLTGAGAAVYVVYD